MKLEGEEKRLIVTLQGSGWMYESTEPKTLRIIALITQFDSFPRAKFDSIIHDLRTKFGWTVEIPTEWQTLTLDKL